MSTKTCTSCGITKPATRQYFDKASHNKDGLTNKCQQCRRDYERTRNKLNNTGHVYDRDYLYALVRAVCVKHKDERERKEAKERRKQWESVH